MAYERITARHLVLACLASLAGCTAGAASSEGPARAGGVPAPLLEAMIADLSKRMSTAPAAIRVAKTESVTWNDGALGCPKPGAMYTQQLIPGYRAILTIGETRFAYHAAASGHFVLCDAAITESPIPPSESPPDR
jgi:hypothetical protein